jgi:hypothetical protein
MDKFHNHKIEKWSREVQRSREEGRQSDDQNCSSPQNDGRLPWTMLCLYLPLSECGLSFAFERLAAAVASLILSGLRDLD